MKTDSFIDCYKDQTSMKRWYGVSSLRSDLRGFVVFFGLDWIDVLLIATLFALAARGLSKHKMPNVRTTIGALGLLLIAHLVFSGFRWQIAPAYLAILVVAITSSMSRRWVRAILFVFTTALVAAASIATWAFPLFDLPQPKGQYAVGFTEIFLTDKSRLEDYTPETDDKRRLGLQVWYPTNAPESGRKRRYLEQPVVRSKAVLGSGPLPWFLLTHLGKVEANSFTEAPIAEGDFPVVIYSHGLGIGWSSNNTPLVEELASQGFIVVAIGHPHIGSSVIFPDKVAEFDPATRVAMDTEPPEEVMEIYSTVKEITDPDKQLDVFMRSMAMMPTSIKGKVDAALATQVDDQAFVLKMLPNLSSAEIDIGAHVDAKNVGFFGMSIGGCASIMTCAINEKCTAVVNMDGFHPDQASAELPVPSLSLHRTDNLLVHVNFNKAKTDAYLVEVSGTTHFNYFDFAILSPLLKKMGILGTIDGTEGQQIQRDFLTAFFKKYLKGMPSPLLDGQETHPSTNVAVRRRSPEESIDRD